MLARKQPWRRHRRWLQRRCLRQRGLTADSLSAGAWAEEPGLAGSAAPTSSAPHANEQNLLDVPIGQVKLPRQLPPEEGMQEAQSIRCFVLA